VQPGIRSQQEQQPEINHEGYAAHKRVSKQLHKQVVRLVG
jgi:hypothetical protein